MSMDDASELLAVKLVLPDLTAASCSKKYKESLYK